MWPPYQSLAGLGTSGVLCAARGSSIFAFGADGSLLSSWQHPAAVPEIPDDDKASANGSGKPANEEEESDPPAKRRKVADNTDEQARIPDAAEPQQRSTSDHTGRGGQKKSRNKSQTKPSDSNIVENVYVNLLKATSSGSHLIAVTGADKTVWVLEHSGKGQLKESSRRTMPKRPSDVALTSDESTLLVADKFGDVYSLPLLPLSDDRHNEELESLSSAKISAPPVTKGANNLTVHSQRNLRALQDQERQRASGQQSKPKEGPDFEHELLIGHVSMLTSIAVASAEGKSYILTADRDEHIRVSRGIPQAYVIEHYCLGHTSFINALCLPSPETLVSGGGDNELYVWDWRTGSLSMKLDFLKHVREILPDANKLAVSKLIPIDDGSFVAICERVPAVLIFKWEGTSFIFSKALQLAGNPLDLAVVSNNDGQRRMVVSLDIQNTANPPLVIHELSEGIWTPSSDVMYQETDIGGPKISRTELDHILYTVENLRKTEVTLDEEGADTPAVSSEVASGPA